MTDIKLSKRMQAVVGMVKEQSVADIGCDHAFVSIYLMKSGICHKVIAMDVKKGPIDIANNNVKAHNLQENISVRLSDGFENLQVGEAQCAIIAGMGGNLMIDILRAGSVHTQEGIKLVLQPQSDIERVREYLVQIGYYIEAEDMLVEDGKFYTIMRAIPVNSSKNNELQEISTTYNKYELAFGPCLLKNKQMVLRQYLDKILSKNQDIINGLSCVDTDSSKERILELNKENNFINNVIELYYA